MRGASSPSYLQPIERIALGFLALLLAAAWFHDTLYRGLWIAGLLLVGLIWLVAFLLTAVSIGWALRDQGRAMSKARQAIAMPLALVLAWLSSGPAMVAGTWSSARVQLWQERESYEVAARAHPGQPLAFPYLEGIPDGGVAIIRWRGDPLRLDPATQARLTGERLLTCRSLATGYHLCGYD